jgi:hypothetical protein
MTQTIKLKKLQYGGYATRDGKFRVYNYMNIWTVIEDIDGEEDLFDFLTLAEAREFIAEKVSA